MTADFAAAEQPKTLTCKRCGKSFPDTGDSMDTVHTCTALVVKEEQDKGSKLEALIEKYRWVVSHSTKEASESIITAAREEHAKLLDQNEKLAIENQRLFRESQQAWTSHKIASEERATLHKLVGEMAGFLIMFIDFHTIPSGDFHTKHGDQVTMDILNMAGELLAKAKLEIGEGR